MTILLLVLLAVNTTALVVVTALYRRARKAGTQRRVEAPNSEYKSQYVEDLEAKERWIRMDLERLHEVNREEFEKILAKVKATSVRALTPAERDFLDRMADAHDRRAREESASGRTRQRSRELPGTS